MQFDAVFHTFSNLPSPVLTLYVNTAGKDASRHPPREDRSRVVRGHGQDTSWNSGTRRRKKSALCCENFTSLMLFMLVLEPCCATLDVARPHLSRRR